MLIPSKPCELNLYLTIRKNILLSQNTLYYVLHLPVQIWKDLAYKNVSREFCTSQKKKKIELTGISFSIFGISSTVRQSLVGVSQLWARKEG